MASASRSVPPIRPSAVSANRPDAEQDDAFRTETVSEPSGDIRPDDEQGNAGHLHDDEIVQGAAKPLGDHGGCTEHEDQQAAKREGLAERVAQEDRADREAEIAASAARRIGRRQAMAQQADERGDDQAESARHDEGTLPAGGDQQPHADYRCERRHEEFNAGHQGDGAHGAGLAEHGANHAGREHGSS